MILWEKNITKSIYVCKYHLSLSLLRHLDLWSSAQSVEVRTFTHHTNSFLTSTVSSPRRFRSVRGDETLSGVIWTVAVNGLIDPGAEALGVLPRREWAHLHEAKYFAWYCYKKTWRCKLWGRASELQTGTVRGGRSAWNPVHTHIIQWDCYTRRLLACRYIHSGVINVKFLRNKQVIYVHQTPLTGLTGTTLYKGNGGDCTLKHTGNLDVSAGKWAESPVLWWEVNHTVCEGLKLLRS